MTQYGHTSTSFKIALNGIKL